MPIERAIVIAKMRGAAKLGQSASSFIVDMKSQGLSYRRTDMLADWRNVNELESKKELFRYVRKDRRPTRRVIAEVDWKLSAEFMYSVKVRSRISPDEPIKERFVNIMQDKPLTPAEVEELAWRVIQEQSPKQIQQVVGVTAWTAVERVLQ